MKYILDKRTGLVVKKPKQSIERLQDELKVRTRFIVLLVNDKLLVKHRSGTVVAISFKNGNVFVDETSRYAQLSSSEKKSIEYFRGLSKLRYT